MPTESTGSKNNVRDSLNGAYTLDPRRLKMDNWPFIYDEDSMCCMALAGCTHVWMKGRGDEAEQIDRVTCTARSAE